MLGNWSTGDEQPETNSLQAKSNKSSTHTIALAHTQHTDPSTSNQKQHQRNHTRTLIHTHIRFEYIAPNCFLRCPPADVVSPLRLWPCDSGCVGKRIGCNRRWCEFLRGKTQCCQQKDTHLASCIYSHMVSCQHVVEHLWYKHAPTRIHSPTYSHTHIDSHDHGSGRPGCLA